MSSYKQLKTLEGYTFTVKTTQLNGVSINLVLMDMENPDESDYWRRYSTNFAKNIVEHLLTQTTQIIFRLSATGTYQASDSDEVIGPITVNSNWPVKIHRHRETRLERINKNFEFVFDPDYYHGEVQGNGGGSSIAEIKDIGQISMSFDFPFEYNANALPSSYRIHNGVLPNGALKLLPYNNDPYCILHCIYNRKHEASTTKALTSDKDYMKRFNRWFDMNNLGRFYHDNCFSLGDIPELEQQLRVNLNVYTIEKGKKVKVEVPINQKKKNKINILYKSLQERGQ